MRKKCFLADFSDVYQSHNQHVSQNVFYRYFLETNQYGKVKKKLRNGMKKYKLKEIRKQMKGKIMFRLKTIKKEEK